MKASGIIRHIDELGRIVVPKEMRRALDISADDPVEIRQEGDRVILSKYQKSCIFCGSESNIAAFKGKVVCRSCLAELSGAVTE